jgi:GntR family transcriptional regulator / MocR family aminotransferase
VARRSVDLGDAVIALPSSAGLHASVYFRDRGVDTGALADRALAAGVALAPLSPYYRASPRAGLALGYGRIAANNIDRGVRTLAACL